MFLYQSHNAYYILLVAYGPTYCQKIFDICANSKFGLLCDETTDRGTDKRLVILARVYDDGNVSTRFIDMPICNLSTADDLFTALDKSLR